MSRVDEIIEQISTNMKELHAEVSKVKHKPKEFLFDSIIMDRDHAWANVCAECAEVHNLMIHDNCTNPDMKCLIYGCKNTTDAVFYIFDKRL